MLTGSNQCSSFALMHPRDQLVEIMQRIYDYSMTTTSGGNLSLLDPDGDIWITPAGVDKGKLVPEDMICVMKDGNIIGRHKPSSEYPFHQTIYQKNSHVKAILHAHPPALAAFSIVRQIPNTLVIPQAADVCGKIGLAKYATPGTQELAKHITESLNDGYDVVLLENHGVVAVGPDLLTAFQRFETLDFCARIIIKAKSLGTEITTLTEEQMDLFNQPRNDIPEFKPKFHTNKELELRKEICDFTRRAYDQRLMTSTEGTLSARIDDNSFLMTPYGIDRKYLNVEDVVLIKDKRREKGKLPSRAILLHSSIYEAHPEISAITTAQPPNIMAYGITDTELDTRTVPENYILLRSIPLLKYGIEFTNGVTSIVSKQTPVVIFQNDAILATGPTILKAFDRLEVAERAAQTVLYSLPLGKIIPLNREQVNDLERNFPVD